MKRVILCLVLFIFTLSIPLTSTKSIEFSINTDILEFATVTIEARDETGNLLESPVIYAYSLDWGIFFPHSSTVQNQVEFNIPQGRWEFIAAEENKESNNKGYFLVSTEIVNSTYKITLKPDAEIDIEPPDDTLNLSQVRILMSDMNLSPLCKPMNVLSLSSGWKGKILTNKNRKYSLYIDANFSRINERLVIFEREIIPNTIYKMSNNRDNLALINFKAFDKSLSPASFYFWLYNSSYLSPYVLGLPISGTGSEKLYVSEGQWAFDFTLQVDKWEYKYPAQTLELKKGSQTNFSYGGKFSPRLKTYKAEDVWCPEILGETMIFVEIFDSFGNLVCEVKPPEKISIPLKLYKNGTKFFEMDLFKFDPTVALYGNAIMMELDINNSPDYLIELDMGPFDSFELKGKLFSQETSLEYETLSTDYFILNYPKGYKEYFIKYGSLVDRIHKILEDYTGIKLDDKIEIKFFLGNTSGIARKDKILAGFAEVIRDSPLIISGSGMIYVAIHEHAHNFQLEREREYFINKIFGESINDQVASFVYDNIWGYFGRLTRLGGIQPFLYGGLEYIENPQSSPLNPENPNDWQSQYNMRFILRLLELNFGEDIHQKFIASWSKTESPMYIPQSYIGAMSSDFEQIAAVYSVLAGENLSSLFNYMGFKVDSAKIDQFMVKIRTGMKDSFPPFLVVDEPEHKIQKELISNKDSITIKGRTEKGSTLKVNNKTYAIGNDVSFECTIPLNEGINTVNVVSTDKAGNSSNEILQVFYDSKLPEITITSPSEGFASNTGDIEVKGVISDSESGVSQLTIDGENVAFYPDGSFSSILNLKDGENKIILSVSDNAENRIELTHTVHANIDTSPPEIIVSLPDEVFEQNLEIKGSVKDEGLSGIKDFSVLINGTKVGLSKSLTLTYNLTLQEGVNYINFEVEDNAGNKTSKLLTVEFTNRKIIKLQIENSTFTVNGISNTLDSPPVIKNNRTLLPIRAIIESLGGSVSWDATERKVTVSLGSNTIELWIGKSIAKVNGIDTAIDSTNPKVVPEIINSRTMLPLRFVTENLGCDVQWDGTTKTITITYQP